MLQYNPSISGSLSVTGSLIVTNGVIGTVSGVDVQIFSSSINQVITGIQAATGSQEGRLTSIESFTSSVSTTNTFTSSASARLNSIETISASNIARINSLETTSASVNSLNTTQNARLSALETTSASVDTLNTTQTNRLNSLEAKTGSLASTGSNTFIGTQVFTGSVYITQNLIVQGSSSLQNITASAVSIGTNTVILNTATPAVRFGGISVSDSGSAAGKSGSLYFDSVDDEWIFVHQGNTAVTSSTVITGPETYDNVGNETHLTDNKIPKMIKGFHIVDSNISDDGTTIKQLINTEVTGSFKITGNGTMGNAFTIQGGTGLTKHYFTSAGSGDALNQLYDNTGTVKVQLYTNGNSYFNGGNVGIGTTNPTYPLTIYASSTQTSMGLMSGYSNSGARNWGIGANSLAYGDFNIAQSTAQGGEPFSAGTSRIYIASSGYVGMGNTNPQAKLHIGASFNTLPVSTSLALAGDSCIRFTGGIDGNSDYGSFVYGAQDSGYRILQLGTRHAGTDSVALNVRGSNVGIGTINPGYPLEVMHSSGYGFKIGTSDSTSANNSAILFYNNASSSAADRRSYMLLDPNGGNGIGGDYAFFDMFGSGTATLMNQLSYGTLALGTGGTAKLYITGSNVGIGTSIPSSTFHVFNGVNANIAANNNAVAIFDGGSGTKNSYVVIASNWLGTGTRPESELQFWNNSYGGASANSVSLKTISSQGNGSGQVNGSLAFVVANNTTSPTVEAMRITNSGSIGIGTTNVPYSNYKVITRVQSDRNLSIGYQGTDVSIEAFNDAVNANVPLRIYGNPTYLLGGNVGIGTTSTGYKLDVYSATDAAIRVNAASGYNSQLRLEEAGTVKFAATYVPGDGTVRMYFAGYGGDLLNFKSGGVGIGTTNAGGYKLFAQGDMGMSGNNFYQGGVQRVVFAGSVAGNSSVSFTINNTSQSVMKITAMMTHYGYINSYGCARMSLVANGPTFQEVNISDTSSGNGGSWSFAQVDSTRFTVTKNAGTYGGGGLYFIEIVGNNPYY